MYNNIEWRDQDPDTFLDSESDDNYNYGGSNTEDYGENDTDSDERLFQRPFGGVLGRPFKKLLPGPRPGPGTIQTPAGSASVKLPDNLATKQELRALEERVLANNKAILVNGKAINRINENMKKMDASVNRRINEQRKTIDSLKQAQMFSLLLPPKLEEIKATVSLDGNGVSTSKVTESRFNMTSALLPALMTGSFGSGMGGGSGSSSGSSDMMLPMILLASSGGFGGSGGSSDNSAMMLALVMMMGNKN